MLRSFVMAGTCESYEVTQFERLSNAIFGSPSIRRANGGFKVRFLKSRGKRPILRRCGDTVRSKPVNGAMDDGDIVERELINKVYRIDESSDGATELPRIWITEKGVKDDDETSASKRAYIASYPNGDDKMGKRALELAERMLGEGFGRCDLDRFERRHFFQAAEILLLHAVDRGNVEAAVKLGDIYRFDLCKGEYWTSRIERRARHANSIDSPALLKRAWVLYALAARNGSAMAYMSLGDMEFDSNSETAKMRAFERYMRSYEIMVERAYGYGGADRTKRCGDLSIELDDIDKQRFGLILLRLAKCFERAYGCQRNLVVAKKLYRCSKMKLEEALEAGCWHNKRDHIEACQGCARCDQESLIYESACGA